MYKAIIILLFIISGFGTAYSHEGGDDMSSLKKSISKQVQQVPCEYVDYLLEKLLEDAPAYDEETIEEHDVSPEQVEMMKEIRLFQIVELQNKQQVCGSQEI